MPSYPVYSADSHIVEPPDLWTGKLPSKFSHWEPRVKHYDETDVWIVGDDRRMAVVGIQFQAGLRYLPEGGISKRARYAELPLLTPERMLHDMELDGVVGGVLYPSNAHQAYLQVHGELLSEILRVYNDWILDYCAGHETRLRPVILLNVDDPVEAAKEFERCAKRGAATAMIPVCPLPGRRFDEARYEVLWSCAEDLDLPIVMHVGANQGVLDRIPVLDLVRHATKERHMMSSLAAMVMAGVFGRHPRLRIGSVEYGASWLPNFMLHADRAYTEFLDEAVWRFPQGELPSDHLKRAVFCTFQQDEAAVRFRDVVGYENLLWGNDYPHAESTFPRSMEFLEEQMRGIPLHEAAAMAGGNCVRLFGFDSPPTIIRTAAAERTASL
jgi:predicted TIM-barrel fold metal-dependent hydrolase